MKIIYKKLRKFLYLLTKFFIQTWNRSTTYFSQNHDKIELICVKGSS